MVIAAGSYPAGRWFESDRRYQNRLLGQAVKTSPFHGGNTSSILVGVTNGELAQLGEHLPYKQGVTGSSPVLPTIQCPVEPARGWLGILFCPSIYGGVLPSFYLFHNYKVLHCGNGIVTARQQKIPSFRVRILGFVFVGIVEVNHYLIVI